MATQAQLAKQALDEMKQATITPEEWCKRIADGYNGKPYNYKITHNYKAQELLFKSANTNPSPAPPTINLRDVQRCLFLTGDTSRALETKNRLLIATADLGYRRFYSDAFLRAAIARGILRVWCDCRPHPYGTPPEIALAWLDQLGLPHEFFYGQCETPNEFDRADAADATRMIGNVNANFRADQYAKIESGEIIVTNETYFNVNRDYGIDWKGLDGVGSNTLACYPSTTEGAIYYPFDQQFADGKGNPDTDCYYIAGMQDRDWNFIIQH